MREVPVRVLITTSGHGETPQIVQIKVPQFLLDQLINRVRAASGIVLPVNTRYDIVATVPDGWVVPKESAA